MILIKSYFFGKNTIYLFDMNPHLNIEKESAAIFRAKKIKVPFRHWWIERKTFFKLNEKVDLWEKSASFKKTKKFIAFNYFFFLKSYLSLLYYVSFRFLFLFFVGVYASALSLVFYQQFNLYSNNSCLPTLTVISKNLFTLTGSLYLSQTRQLVCFEIY